MIWLLLPLAIALSGRPVGAQVARPSCATQAQHLRTIGFARATPTELGLIRRCPDEFPVLAREWWSQENPDSAGLLRLTGLSGNQDDERVFTALTRTLADPSRPERIRLAAAEALVTQASPCAFVAAYTVRPTQAGRIATIAVGRWSHATVYLGREPRAGPAMPRVLRTLTGVAASEAPGEFRQKVTAILDGLRFAEERGGLGGCTPTVVAPPDARPITLPGRSEGL